VHSAPSTGVRDWSDLRIAVAAGVWLASGRPGDSIVVVSDDHAFDAVGDVAASLGVTFQRLSYRALAGITAAEVPAEETAAAEPRSRRRSRGGRRRSWPRSPSPVAAAPAAHLVAAPPPELEESTGHTAPHDELLAVVRELNATAPGGVNLDNLSNALKARGFARPPGSPRLITRLRRIKELEVGRNGSIRLVDTDGDAPEPAAHAIEPAGFDAPDVTEEAGEEQTAEGEGDEPGPEGGAAAPRRRRRRGGRRRRGRGRNGAATAAPVPDVPL
jgi:hypothetical protein